MRRKKAASSKTTATIKATSSKGKPVHPNRGVKKAKKVKKRTIKIYKVKQQKPKVLSPPSTPTGSFMSLDTPQAPVPAQRCLFMPAFDQRSLSPIPFKPRSMPDEAKSLVDDGAFLPFHPVSNKPAVVKHEEEDLDTKPAAAATESRKKAVPSKNVDVVIPDDQTQHEKDWNSFLPSVLVFVAKHGHCNIPYNYPEDMQLARWAKRQRYQYKLYMEKQAGKKTKNVPSITGERIKALNSVGFCWNLHEIGWEAMLQEFKQYVLKKGNGRVPKGVPKLGRWVGAQRTQLRAGKMKLEHFIKLQDAGFEFWVQRNNQDLVDAWTEMREKVAQRDQEAFMKEMEKADPLGSGEEAE